MTTIYEVVRWSELYENNRSRLLKELDWLALPNSHDGESYGRLMARKDAAVVFAAWILVLQVASRCDPRGTLMRSNGEPHDPVSLAFKTRAPARWFTESLPVLVELGWIQRNSLDGVDMAPGAALVRHDPVTEGKGREGKEGKGNRAPDGAVLVPNSLKTPEFEQAWADWLTYRAEMRKPIRTMHANAVLADLAAIGPVHAVAAIRHTIFKGWQGLREPEGNDIRKFQQQARPINATPVEPIGWRECIATRFADSVFAPGGSCPAKTWADLPAYAKDAINDQMKKDRQ